MSSKKRTLATNNNMNYNDYIKLKSGSEALKTAKYNNKNGVINRFTNYNQFQTLSAAYYKGIDLDKCDIYPTRDLYNSNTSYIVKDYDNLYKNDTCELEKQILYPYGFYKSNKVSDIYYPYKLCLENWCKKKVVCFEYNVNCNNDCNNDCNNNDSNSECSSDYNSDCNKSNNNCHNKKCKTGLCKNAKPLFI